MTAIEACGLTKCYGKKVAVSGIGLSVRAGEIFSLLGTNGAGKTTAVKLLSTLTEPTGGSAFVHGLDTVKDKMKIREMINVSPQETAIAKNLTVLENLEFMAGAYGISEPKERIDTLVSAFGLGDILKQKGKTLSGGWQRKLSIALALINDPKVLFLDEPTLGLDVIARRELWKTVESLRGRVTVILTTHYMEEAERLSDRIAVMNKGRIIALGSPDELKKATGKERFDDVFTALIEGGSI